MKFKQKGRKIYKTKEKNFYGKSKASKIMSGALTVLLIGGLCFLGYSAAEPIINYTKKAGDSSGSDSEKDSTQQSTTIPSATNGTDSFADPVSSDEFRAASIDPQALTDISLLQTALRNIPSSEGIEYVAVPLKISGGELYYASEVYQAKSAGAVKSSLTLAQITTETISAGFRPAAVISVFEDNILPAKFPSFGFINTDGSAWTDGEAHKQWTSPFSKTAQDYVNAVASEILSAGFDRVICTKAEFPEMSDADLQSFAAAAGIADSDAVLAEVINDIQSEAVSKGKPLYLEISAAELLRGSDVFQPEQLDVSTIVLNIDFDEMGTLVDAGSMVYEFTGTNAENAEKALGLLEKKLQDFDVVVRFSGDGLYTSDLLDVKEVISDFGYSSFIIG